MLARALRVERGVIGNVRVEDGVGFVVRMRPRSAQDAKPARWTRAASEEGQVSTALASFWRRLSSYIAASARASTSSNVWSGSAHIDSGAQEVIREVQDPSVVVTEAVNAFHAQAAAKKVELISEVAPGKFLAAFDATRILQVLANLLSNAIKFTPAKGKVSVRAELVEREVRFAISDTGSGIPVEKLGAVFGRFMQVTKNDRRGVGLGLYIAKCIVLGHDGRIWAESEPGRGTTVFSALPSVPGIESDTPTQHAAV